MVSSFYLSKMSASQMYQAKLARSRAEAVEVGYACEVCKGTPRLCDASLCPYFRKMREGLAACRKLCREHVYGSSPPSVLVGHSGYPVVNVGPLLVPETGRNAGEDHARWLEMSVEDLVRMRVMTVRANEKVRVNQACYPSRNLREVHEIVMSSKPVDMEVKFRSKPRLSLSFYPRAGFYGPSGDVKAISVTENPTIPKRVEYIVNDKHLTASEAVAYLYESGLELSYITRLFSSGILGIEERRKLVPSEWSITAVDDIIGRKLRSNVLSYPLINEYMVFGYMALYNNIQILLIPNVWMFEGLEAWVLNGYGKVFSDAEMPMSRYSYPHELGGAYHALRLPILEYLNAVRKQCAAVAFIEVYRGWVPLGVWRIREIARKALKLNPLRFNKIEDAISELERRLYIPIERWISKSKILKRIKFQTVLV